MAGFKGYITALVMVMVFGLALFMFMGNYLAVNNPTSNVLTDSRVNASLRSINNSITDFQDYGKNAQKLLASDEPSAGSYLFLIFKSAFYIPLNVLKAVGNSINLFSGFIFQEMFGASTDSPFYLVFSVFAMIMIITAVILIIQFIRTGQGER